MPTLLNAAAEKKRKINEWGATAIGLKDAADRDLVQISVITVWRNWDCREAIYDFAQQATQSNPVLVRIDHKRVALFGVRAKTSIPSSQKASCAF